MDKKFDEYVTAADVRQREDMEAASREFVKRLDCERRGVDPDCPLLSWGR
jgi:methionine synthase II (cobalamin-independent)